MDLHKLITIVLVICNVLERKCLIKEITEKDFSLASSAKECCSSWHRIWWLEEKPTGHVVPTVSEKWLMLCAVYYLHFKQSRNPVHRMELPAFMLCFLSLTYLEHPH